MYDVVDIAVQIYLFHGRHYDFWCFSLYTMFMCLGERNKKDPKMAKKMSAIR